MELRPIQIDPVKFGVEEFSSVLESKFKLTIVELFNIVSKYKTIGDFKDDYGDIHTLIKKFKLSKIILKDLKHRTRYRKWSYSKCKSIVSDYNNYTKFFKEQARCLEAIKRNGWYDLISHLKRSRKPNGYWTYDKCKEEVNKYTLYKDFVKNSGSCSVVIMKNGWHDLTKDLIRAYTDGYKYIYAYEFPDNNAYIGLTYDIEDRKIRHSKEGTVYEHIKKTNLEPKIILLTGKVSKEKAVELEEYYKQFYEKSGWGILNKAKTGSLGGNTLIWTFERCRDEASKYDTRTKFCRGNGSAYSACLRGGWLDEVCSHMDNKRKPGGYWTYDRCSEVADKCKTNSEFSKKYPGAYCKARERGWLKSITNHMTIRGELYKNITFTDCIEVSKDCKTFSEFINKYNVYYRKAVASGWKDDIKKLFVNTRKPNGFWTLEECLKVAKLCSNTKEYRKRFGAAYNAVYKNKWYSHIQNAFNKIDV